MPELAKRALLDLLSPVEDLRVRGLLELLLLAHEPFKKKIVWDLFRDLGVIHLLVISGSHIQYFLRALKMNLTIVFRILGLNHSRGLDGMVGVGVLSLLKMTSYEVALVRAACCWFFLHFASRGYSIGTLLLAAAVTQGLLFPEHLSRPGFYLSWVCYLMVLISEQLKWGLLVRVFALTGVSQILVWSAGIAEIPSFQVFSLYCLCNVLLVWMFEVFLFGFLSQLLALVFLLSFLGKSILTSSVEILELTMLPVIIFGAKIVCLAAELLKTL